jgi:hypothetical protein
VVAAGTGSVVKKLRPAISGSVSPLAEAVILAAVGALVAGFIAPPVNRFLDGF